MPRHVEGDGRGGQLHLALELARRVGNVEQAGLVDVDGGRGGLGQVLRGEVDGVVAVRSAVGVFLAVGELGNLVVG